MRLYLSAWYWQSPGADPDMVGTWLPLLSMTTSQKGLDSSCKWRKHREATDEQRF